MLVILSDTTQFGKLFRYCIRSNHPIWKKNKIFVSIVFNDGCV